MQYHYLRPMIPGLFTLLSRLLDHLEPLRKNHIYLTIHFLDYLIIMSVLCRSFPDRSVNIVKKTKLFIPVNPFGCLPRSWPSKNLHVSERNPNDSHRVMGVVCGLSAARKDRTWCGDNSTCSTEKQGEEEVGNLFLVRDGYLSLFIGRV